MILFDLLKNILAIHKLLIFARCLISVATLSTLPAIIPKTEK